MRRAILCLLASVVAAPMFRLARAGSQHHDAQRLLGTWQSDREQTVAHWQFGPEVPVEARAKVASWFGRFTYAFTPKRVTASFDGGTWTAGYRVTSATANAISLEVLHADGRESLSFYFDGPYFLVRSGKGVNFEYFKRAEA